MICIITKRCLPRANSSSTSRVVRLRVMTSMHSSVCTQPTSTLARSLIVWNVGQSYRPSHLLSNTVRALPLQEAPHRQQPDLSLSTPFDSKTDHSVFKIFLEATKAYFRPLEDISVKVSQFCSPGSSHFSRVHSVQLHCTITSLLK